MAYINVKYYTTYNLNYDEIANNGDIILILKALNITFYIPNDEIDERFLKLIEKNLIIKK